MAGGCERIHVVEGFSRSWTRAGTGHPSLNGRGIWRHYAAALRSRRQQIARGPSLLSNGARDNQANLFHVPVFRCSQAASLASDSNRLTIYDGRHPTCASARQPGLKGFALEVVHARCLREPSPVVQAIHIENGQRRWFTGIRCGSNEHTALAAEQEVTGARTESVESNESPIVRRHAQQSRWIRYHSRFMALAK